MNLIYLKRLKAYRQICRKAALKISRSKTWLDKTPGVILKRLKSLHSHGNAPYHWHLRHQKVSRADQHETGHHCLHPRHHLLNIKVNKLFVVAKRVKRRSISLCNIINDLLRVLIVLLLK